MALILTFIKSQLDYIGAHVIVVSLIVFYYFVLPDYIFLSTFFTIIIWGGISIYRTVKKESSRKKGKF